MAKRDYYEVLGVSRNATDAELKKAYRRLAMKHHPDRNEGNASAEEKFKEAKEAHDILSDERKRAAYDQFGRDHREPLTLDTVEGWADEYRREADRLLERYRRAPSPDQMIADLMDGAPTPGL